MGGSIVRRLWYLQGRMSPPSPDIHILADAVRCAPMGVVLASVDGHVLRANPAYCALLGCAEGALVGRPLSDPWAADGAAAAAEVLALLATGRAAGRRQVRRADGAPLDLDVTLDVVRERADDPESAPRYLVGYAQVVTAPRARPAAEDPLEQAFVTAPVGMAYLDPAFCFRRVNPALARMLATPAEALVGRPFGDFLHPDQRAAAEAEMLRAAAGEVVGCDTEWHMLDASGRYVHVRLGGSRLATFGDVRYFGVFIDVTAQREADVERAHLQDQVVHAERLRTLGQIAGGIAHEVNNPAAIAVGGVDLARRHIVAITNGLRAGDTAVVRRHLERLEASLRYCEDGTARLARVARKLSAFSSLHGGDVEQIDVNDLSRRVLGLLEADLRARADLRIDLAPVPTLVAHPERLVQALTNLLVNASQAVEGMPAEQRITLSTRSNGAEIEIVVEDTGAGMPQATLDRIFEPFYTTRGRAEGSGLGLAVVFDVVRQHRGRIDVKSEPGRGSRFTLYLPFQNGLGPGASASRPPVTTRARVLVVDDEPFLLAILAEILSTEHDVVTASGGPEALELLGSDLKFDALLCDLMMPGVDGIAVHRFLLERAPALAARTVFATGGAFTPRTAGYVSSRNVPVLVKPFTAEEVRSTMATALSTAPAEGEAAVARPKGA